MADDVVFCIDSEFDASWYMMWAAPPPPIPPASPKFVRCTTKRSKLESVIVDSHASAMATLRQFMADYPMLVFLDGEELHVFREELIRQSKLNNRTFIMTSWERGLKHAGLRVIQSTHGTQPIKKWVLNGVSHKLTVKVHKPPIPTVETLASWDNQDYVPYRKRTRIN